METTNKEIVYCQKVLHLLEDLQKVQQSIESFAEHSDKQKIHTHQSLSLILKLAVLLIILGLGIFLKLSLVLLLVISVVYLFIFCLLFRYDSKRFKEKLALEGESSLKMKSLNADLNKLKEDEEKIQTELNHFRRIPTQFKTLLRRGLPDPDHRGRPAENRKENGGVGPDQGGHHATRSKQGRRDEDLHRERRPI